MSTTRPPLPQNESVHAPFLDTDPPPIVARGLSTVLLLTFVIAIIICSVIELPVLVIAPFTLVPARGTDPLRAPQSGIVTEVAAREGERVESGAAVVWIRSETLAERVGEKRAVSLGIESAKARIDVEKKRHESQLKVDREERTRLEQRIAALDKQIVNAKKEIVLLQQMADQAKEARTQGVGTSGTVNAREMDLVRAEGALARLEGDRAEARSAVTRVSREMEVRERDLEAFERSQKDEIDRGRVREAALQDSPIQSDGNRVAVTAPCNAMVLRLHVKGKGAVVSEGDALVELVCEGDTLEAELAIEGSGFGLMQQDHTVKLFYDAFPHQRHGSRRGRVRFIGPSGSGERPKLRVLASLTDGQAFVVKGQTYPLMPGMSGRAEVIVDKRTPIGFLFQPIRQLREVAKTD
jgi:multidrug efflux pump subunit AcrA (membrane-fusion protein)